MVEQKFEEVRFHKITAFPSFISHAQYGFHISISIFMFVEGQVHRTVKHTCARLCMGKVVDCKGLVLC